MKMTNIGRIDASNCFLNYGILNKMVKKNNAAKKETKNEQDIVQSQAEERNFDEVPVFNLEQHVVMNNINFVSRAKFTQSARHNEETNFYKSSDGKCIKISSIGDDICEFRQYDNSGKLIFDLDFNSKESINQMHIILYEYKLDSVNQLNSLTEPIPPALSDFIENNRANEQAYAKAVIQYEFDKHKYQKQLNKVKHESINFEKNINQINNKFAEDSFVIPVPPRVSDFVENNRVNEQAYADAMDKYELDKQKYQNQLNELIQQTNLQQTNNQETNVTQMNNTYAQVSYTVSDDTNDSVENGYVSRRINSRKNKFDKSKYDFMLSSLQKQSSIYRKNTNRLNIYKTDSKPSLPDEKDFVKEDGTVDKKAYEKAMNEYKYSKKHNK